MQDFDTNYYFRGSMPKGTKQIFHFNSDMVQDESGTSNLPVFG
jgi:hypothetical protein